MQDDEQIKQQRQAAKKTALFLGLLSLSFAVAFVLMMVLKR